MRTVGELKEIGAKSPDANSQKPIVYVSIYKHFLKNIFYTYVIFVQWPLSDVTRCPARMSGEPLHNKIPRSDSKHLIDIYKKSVFTAIK